MKKVLHVFNQYLPKTEKWAYQLIAHTTQYEQHIASKVYLEETPGREQFSFMDNPSSKLELLDQKTDWKKNIFKKAYIRGSKQLNRSFADLLKDYLIKNEIDVVHAHFANMGWEILPIVKLLDLPLVVSFYGWDYEMLPHVKPEWKERYTQMFAVVDLVLVEGKHGKQTLNKKGCEEHKIKVQKLGIEKDLINFSKREKKRDELRLIQIASFTEKKGQIFTVKGFAKALERCPDMQLTLIGDKREKEYWEKTIDFIKKNKLESKVEIKDFIAYERLSEELSKFHVFIHPSCYAENMNCEGGAPTIIFNAAGSGMPTLGTTHCDIPSLVVDGQTGALSAEKDIEALAENIVTFYKMDSEQYEKFCIASHVHIAENYCIENNGKLLAGIYNELLSNVS